MINAKEMKKVADMNNKVYKMVERAIAPLIENEANNGNHCLAIKLKEDTLFSHTCSLYCKEIVEYVERFGYTTWVHSHGERMEIYW